jgi:O-antigen/teichoic acid export membrane protein
MPSTSKRLVNLSLRAATLVSKFALIFVLAKFLEPTEVGLYGLLSATVFYVLMALGFDFYTFASRELIVTDRRNWAGMLRDQGVFYGITYSALLPLCLLLFWLGLLPWQLAVWFFPLLALEHLAQELNRLLVAISEPLWASIVLFVRSGAWAIIAALWMWFDPVQRSLDFVLAAWAIGVFVSCLLGASRLRGFDRASLQRAIDWAWIRKGIRVALPFVLATLSLRALYTVDRYWIEALGGLEQLAAYVLFVGIANAIMSFLDAAVFTFAYPALIASAGKADRPTFDRQMRRLGQHTLAVALGLSIAAVVCAGPLIDWLDRPSYTQHFSLLYWTVLAAALFGISMIPHYGLYARREDRTIVFSHLASLPIFLLGALVLIPLIGVAAVPAAMCLAFLFLLLAKLLAFKRCGPLAAPV